MEKLTNLTTDLTIELTTELTMRHETTKIEHSLRPALKTAPQHL